MGFAVEFEQRLCAGQSVPVYVLHDSEQQLRAEVWPANGFNLLRWQTRPANDLLDWLYCAPDWESNPVPTRSGFPILFPFPNRIRGGRFTWDGREYHWPLLDSTRQNAIHGLAPRRAWEVVHTNATADHASITGKFRMSPMRSGPDWLWPGEADLFITYTLRGDCRESTVTVDCHLVNTGRVTFPFGLGFHPYFRLADSASSTVDDVTLTSPTATLWELDESLPTGRKVAAPAELNFSHGQPIGATKVDHLYGDLASLRTDPEKDLQFAGELRANSGSRVSVWYSPAFRELVLFTPVHRQAVCIEPYTCATDAVHLSDGGWIPLAPGSVWSGTVEARIRSGG